MNGHLARGACIIVCKRREEVGSDAAATPKRAWEGLQHAQAVSAAAGVVGRSPPNILFLTLLSVILIFAKGR